jgi:hypothetical protein
VLAISRQHLWTGGMEQLSRPYRFTDYTCIAMHMAKNEGKVTRQEAVDLQDLLMTRIRPSPLLAGYLHSQGKMPEHLKMAPGGYNLRHKDYVKIRDEFLDLFTKELELTEVAIELS